MRVVFLKKSFLLRVGIVALILVGALIYARSLFSEGEPVMSENTAQTSTVQEASDNVALSFDTAFGEDMTLAILDVLKQQNVTATFSVVGAWANENSQLLRLIHADGHEIISHSMNHDRYTDMTDEEILQDAQSAQAAISGLAGVQTNLIRVPYGACDERVESVLASGGFETVGWTLDSNDWNEQADIVTNVTQQATGGDIVLFQNNVPNTAQALTEIIETLRANALTFVTISQME